MRIALDEVLARQALKPDGRYEFERNAVAEAVSVWLVEYRAEQGLSKAHLAAGCGVSQPGIALPEAGDVEPKLSKLLRLPDALGEALAIQLLPADRGLADTPHVALARCHWRLVRQCGQSSRRTGGQAASGTMLHSLTNDALIRTTGSVARWARLYCYRPLATHFRHTASS